MNTGRLSLGDIWFNVWEGRKKSMPTNMVYWTVPSFFGSHFLTKSITRPWKGPVYGVMVDPLTVIQTYGSRSQDSKPAHDECPLHFRSSNRGEKVAQQKVEHVPFTKSTKMWINTPRTRTYSWNPCWQYHSWPASADENLSISFFWGVKNDERYIL